MGWLMEEQEKLTAIPSQLSGPGRSDCFGERSQLFGTSLPQLCPEAGAGQAQHLLCITEGVATCVLVKFLVIFHVQKSKAL